MIFNQNQPRCSLSTESIRSLQPANFKENTDRINGSSFSNDGKLMITSSNDDTLTVYDICSGRKQRKINLPKAGCFDVRFLHAANNVILAARKLDYSVRHFSLHDNKFIRYFKGHEKPVTHLAVSPDDDLFFSTSSDNTVRLWDVRVQEPVAILYVTYSPNVAFDPEGLIFAVSIGTDYVKLYDKRNYGNGPFATFDLSHIGDSKWSDITFSNDGKKILIATEGNHLRLLDSFEGSLTHTLTGHSNDDRLPLRAGFTPCSEYIFCGGSDKKITFWQSSSGILVHQLETNHPKPIEIVDFNPAYHLLTSTCIETKLWTPNNDFCRRLQPPNSGNYRR